MPHHSVGIRCSRVADAGMVRDVTNPKGDFEYILTGWLWFRLGSATATAHNKLAGRFVFERE